MTWAVVFVRTIVGLGFTVLGLDYFLHFLNAPQPELPPLAMQFGMILAESKYMTVVKVLEILGGINLLSGRFALLGLAILIPISVNILLFDLLLVKSFGGGCILVPLLLFVLFGYRKTVKPIFDGSARIG